MGFTQRIPDAKRQGILAKLRHGLSNRQVARDFSVDERTVRRIKACTEHEEISEPAPKQPERRPEAVQYLDKKVSSFDWKEAISNLSSMQEMYKKASSSQLNATVKVGNGVDPIGLMAFGDQHIGARGTDYVHLLEITEVLLRTPNLYAVLTGDVAEWAVKLRGVAEVTAQLLDPNLQLQFIEQWFDLIRHKVVAATWGNHTDDRSEANLGTDPVKAIFSRHVPYFSGIGHLKVHVGNQTYNGVISHKFQGVTQLDSTAGAKKYLRMEWPMGDFAIQGDCHRAGVSIYNEGHSHRVAISNGTLHTHSTYAQRYFSTVTSMSFPVLALWPDKKQMVPFFNVEHFMDTLALQPQDIA